MARRTTQKATRYEIVENEFIKFDKVYGAIEALWIKDPSVRQRVNVVPLIESYRVFQDLREIFKQEHLEAKIKEAFKEITEQLDAMETRIREEDQMLQNL